MDNSYGFRLRPRQGLLPVKFLLYIQSIQNRIAHSSFFYRIVAPPIDHLPGEYVVSLDNPSDLNLVLAHPNPDDSNAAQLQSWSFIL